MTQTFTTVFQILALLAQVLNIVLPVVPDKYKIYVTTGLAVVQAIQANRAHLFNTDGTPQETAFQPPPSSPSK